LTVGGASPSMKSQFEKSQATGAQSRAGLVFGMTGSAR
jgi:hypothetical protein